MNELNILVERINEKKLEVESTMNRNSTEFDGGIITALVWVLDTIKHIENNSLQ